MSPARPIRFLHGSPHTRVCRDELFSSSRSISSSWSSPKLSIMTSIARSVHRSVLSRAPSGKRCGICGLRTSLPSLLGQSRTIASSSRFGAAVKPGPALSQTNSELHHHPVHMQALIPVGAEITLRRFWKTVLVQQEATGPSSGPPY